MKRLANDGVWVPTVWTTDRGHRILETREDGTFFVPAFELTRGELKELAEAIADALGDGGA